MDIWISLALAFSAFVALAVGMTRHQEDLTGRTLSAAATMAWRLAGIAGLGLALGACLQTWSVSVGVAAWVGLLTFAALLVGGLLTYASQWVMRLAAASAAGSVLAWLLHGHIQ